MDATTYAQDKRPDAGVVRIAGRLDDGAEPLLEAAHDAASAVRVVETGPTGAPALEPIVLCTREGETAIYPRPDADEVRAAVETLESGHLPETAAGVASHESDVDALSNLEEGPLTVGCRRVLGPCGWIDPESPGDHRFLDDVIGSVNQLESVGELGLLGRGRGDATTDEPAYDEWTTVRDADGDGVVVVNANEADDRSLADELLLEGAPLTVLDAAAAVAEFVDATDVVVYCNEADERICERLRRVVDAAGERLPVVPQVVAGPDTFRAGEETMALEAIEGADRLEARIRPPGPAEHGLYGRPTVVHTPRTFAQVYRALTHPSEFDSDHADPGTRLVTVTGDVETPATVELRTGSALEAATDAVDPTGGSAYKAAVIGGQFGGLTSDLDVPAGAPALRGAGLGTNGVVELLDESRCVVAEVGTRARFAAEENCGRCVPCREGSTQLVNKLRDVYDGECDADGLRELARSMRRSSICDFGVAAGRMVSSALEEFEPEFEAHAAGRCPSDFCER